MFRQSIFAIIFIGISFLSAFSQTSATISGRVLGGVGNAEKITIKITSSDSSHTTMADKNGEFRFADLPAGQYSISAEQIDSQNGSTILTRSILLNLGAGETKSINLEFSEVIDPNYAEVIVNIAEDIDQPLTMVSKSVNVIDARELRERADFSLIESLRTIPGFRAQQLGGFGKAASIKTRGLRNQDTALLIDGFRFRDPSSINGDASAFLSDITLTSVSKIEVLRGSGSSLYGTNAIAGAVDFRTPSPRAGLHGQISGALGGLGLKRVRTNLSDGAADGQIGFNLGVSRTVYSEGIDGDDPAHNTNFNGRIDWKPTKNSILSSRVMLTDSYVKLNSSPDTLGTLPAISTTIDAESGKNFAADQNDPDNDQRGGSYIAQFDFKNTFSDGLVFNASFQSLGTSRKNVNGPAGAGFQPFGGIERSKYSGKINTARAAFDWFNKRGFVNFGYEFENEKYHNDGSAPIAGSNYFVDASQTSNTAFVSNSTRFFEGRLQFNGGARIQIFSLAKPQFSVSGAPYSNLTLKNPPQSITLDGSFMYRFEKMGTKIRSHIGNGYRVPSLYERFGAFFSSYSQSFTAIGDPYLKPERSFGGDVGIDQSLGKYLEASAVYFYTKLIDTIGYSDTVPSIGTTARPWGGYLNQSGGISRGAEISMQTRNLRSTQIFTSYTYTNSDQRIPQVAGSGIIATLGIPDHQFSAVVTQRFKGLSANFDLLLTSSYLTPIFSSTIYSSRIYRFKGNRRADFTLRYEFSRGSFLEENDLRFTVFGSVENLFDYEYFENGFVTAGRNAKFGFGVSF